MYQKHGQSKADAIQHARRDRGGMEGVHETLVIAEESSLVRGTNQLEQQQNNATCSGKQMLIVDR